jgi:hypothetical protein
MIMKKILFLNALAILYAPFTAFADQEACLPKATYDGKTISVTFCFSDVGLAKGKPKLYAGLTVQRASDGFQFDLPAKEISAADLDGPITIAGKVGPGFTRYWYALWDQKNQCSKGRHGCRTYGYELDSSESSMGELAALSYSYNSLIENKITLLDSGGGEALVDKANVVLTAAIREFSYTDIAKIEIGGVAKTKRDFVEVLYKNKWDRAYGLRIAKVLEGGEAGIRFKATHWPEAPSRIVIAIGGIAQAK